METLILKEEWAIKCNNCGGDSHCETRTTRTEQQYEVDGGKDYNYSWHSPLANHHCNP